MCCKLLRCSAQAMKLRLFPCIVLACAITFSIVAVLLHILQRVDGQYPFQGVEIMAADAEVHYTARVREIYDGFWQTGNTFYADLKHTPYMQPPFPEMIPAYVARALGVDPVPVFVLFSALCAFALLLVTTGALTALTGDAWASLLATCTLLFAGFFLGAPWDLGKVLSGSGGFEPLRFSRVINPLWTVPWFFGAVWLVAAWLRTRKFALLLCSAIPLLVLVYSYVYAWSYIAAALVMLLCWYAVKRDMLRAKHLTYCAVLVTLCSIPYGLHVLETISHPFYPESALRQGVITTHAPMFSAWFIPVALTIALTYKRWPTTWPFVTTLLLAGVVVLNQQILTGRALVAHHYHWYFFHPLASLCFLALAYSLVGHWKPVQRIRTPLFVVVLTVAVLLGIRYQSLAYATARDHWGRQQQLAPVLAYIDQHFGTGTVVYSPSVAVMDLVAVHTSADVYTSGNANQYLVPVARARDVFFFDLWVRGKTPEDIRQEFPTTLRSALGSALYSIHFREQYGSYQAVPDDVVAENILAYERYSALSDSAKISKHRIDVLVLADDIQQTPAVRTLLSASRETLRQNGYSVRILHDVAK